MKRSLAGLLAVAFAAAGCGDPGPPTGTVKGKVLIGGAAPPEAIRVNFINSTIGQGANAETAPDGSYTLPMPLRVGEYTVYFERIVVADGPVSTAAEQLTLVPKEYRNEMSSPLKKTVSEEENTIDLEVPSGEAKG